MRGHGDGPAAATLRPLPRNFADASWQAGVTDAYLAQVIVAGGAGVGKSMMMPPSPDLAERPQIVAELVAIVRGSRP